jgi:Ras-related protein Rab-8A
MAQRDVTFDMQVKLLLVGDSGVGKTCMLLRYVNDSFSPCFAYTIGVDFDIKNVRLDGKLVKCLIWDTAGQERFRSIRTSHYRDAHGIMLVYDITVKESFVSIRNWVAEIQRHANVNVNTILIGHKCDCEDRRAVSFGEGEALAKEYSIPFYEVSSKLDRNVHQAFITITTDVRNRLMADHCRPEIRKGLLGHFFSNFEAPWKVKVPHGGTDVRVELTIQGAKSWYNMHKINGRYIPHHEYYHEYTNVDAFDSKLVYIRNHWVVMKNKKVLATIKSPDALPPILDPHAKVAEVWFENYGVVLTRMFKQPALTCTTLDLEKERPRGESIVVEGEIDIEKFIKCCEEPERLGLTIPLFVSYSRVKMAVAELDYASSRLALDLEKMKQLHDERQRIEERCKSLLATVGKEAIKFEPLPECAPTLVCILPALTTLVAQIKEHFEEMCDLHNGNLDVARKCRDTLSELDEDLQRLSLNPSTPNVAPGDHRGVHAQDTAQEVGIDLDTAVEGSSPLPADATVESSPQGNTDALLEHLSTRVVQSSKKDWTCTITKAGWIATHESENRTDTEIDFRCLISSGNTKTQSTKVNITLAAGMSLICASVGLDKSWSSSATGKSEREHHVKIAPRTKLTIEQEVVEGHITFAKSMFATKGAEKPFRVAKDSLRIQTSPVAK